MKIERKGATLRKKTPITLLAGDIDNHLKAVLDALSGICFTDDRQVIEGHVYLFKGDPQVEIQPEEIQ